MQSLRALTLAFYFAPVLLTLPLYKFFPSFHNRWWALLVTAIEVHTRFPSVHLSVAYSCEVFRRFGRRIHGFSQNSGAAFVKFGQWAASRSDLFSPDVCERLGKLRNRAPTHAFSITKSTFYSTQSVIAVSCGLCYHVSCRLRYPC